MSKRDVRINESDPEAAPVPETDIELARRARQGDEDACHEIVERYGAMLYRLAFSLVGNAADGEDVAQEALAGAFRGIQSFEGRSSLKTWLSRILVRQAARWRRSRRTIRPLDDSERDQRHESADARMDIAEILQVLSPDHREVIVLREMQGMTYDEIAETMDIPRGTVESRLFRARQILRERLKDYRNSGGTR